MERESALLKRQKQLFLIFKVAIESEREAQVQYKAAQRFCDDPVLKKILQGIEKQEAAHEKALIRYYARIKKRISAGEEPA